MQGDLGMGVEDSLQPWTLVWSEDPALPPLGTSV